LGADAIHAARLRRDAKRWHVEWAREAKLPEGFFAKAPGAEHERTLAEALQHAAPELSREHVSLHLSFPDPLASYASFSFEQMPASAAEREALAAWRFEHERHVTVKEWECRSQDAGETKGRRALYGVAAPKAWVALFKAAARRIGAVPWVMDAEVNFRFNVLADALAEQRAPLAWLHADVSAWTLIVSDAEGCPRFVRSKWSTPPDTGDGVARLAREIDRWLQTYVRNRHTGPIEKLWLTGRDALDPALETYFSAQTKLTVFRPGLEDYFSWPEKKIQSAALPAVLTAAGR
jgi:Tfp pilus assembly PilM family ATPase